MLVFAAGDVPELVMQAQELGESLAAKHALVRSAFSHAHRRQRPACFYVLFSLEFVDCKRCICNYTNRWFQFYAICVVRALYAS